MIWKNIALLTCLAWTGLTYAKHPVVQEGVSDALQYKVEGHKGQQQKRQLAGSKEKKATEEHKTAAEGQRQVASDSEEEFSGELKYWKYSEQEQQSKD